MLPDAENKKPDQHHGKGWRIKSNKQDAYRAQDIGQSGLPPGTQKEQDCGNNNR